MMSSTIEESLERSVTEPVEKRLKRLGDTIKDVEENLKLPKDRNRLKPTNRLCGKLTTLISSVRRDPTATSDQLQVCAGYAVRVRKFNPRRIGKQPDLESGEGSASTHTEHEKFIDEQRKKVLSTAHVNDGFDPTFLNVYEVIGRVTDKYTERPRWNDLENERLLQVALGEIPLGANSAKHLWLALSYAWKARGGCFDAGKTFSGLMAPQAEWTQSAICSFANRHQIPLPTPNIFSLIDNLAWRS